MRPFILVLCFCFSLNIFASQFVNGEGRFYAKDEDSLAFVKKQLLYSAYRDVLSRELLAMGLDVELFWRNIDSRFEEYFTPIDEKLRKKYSMDADKVNPRTKEVYEKVARSKRLSLKSRFGKLARAITSYSIQKMTRSTREANSRYLSLQAKVDREILNKIYLEFTLNRQARQFQNLFLTVKFQLEDMGWNEVGVETESDFSQVVAEHWRKWLSARLEKHVSEVIVPNGEIESQLQSYLKIPAETSETLQNVEEKKDLVEKVEGVEAVTPSKDLMGNSLWLRVNVKISKKGEDSLLKQRDFELDGEFVLVDLKNNSLATYFDFEKEKKSYSYEDAHKLSSNLASLVYRLPMGEFNNLKGRLNNLPAELGKVNLRVSNITSIQDLFSLKETLTTKGVTHQFTPKIDTYSKNNGKLSLSFRGSDEELTEVLLSLDNQNIGNNKKISFPSKENPFDLTLMEAEVEDVEKGGEVEKLEENEKEESPTKA